MIALVTAWGLSGLIIGYLGGTHDVRVSGWVLLAMAAGMWIVQTSHRAYLKNVNASAMLEMTAARRRSGGAL